MTAVITLALLALALGVSLALTVRWGISAKDEANTAGDLLRGTKDLVAAQSIEIAQLKQQNAIATTRLKIAEKQRNDAQTAERQKIAARIRAAKPDEAARVVNEILAEPMFKSDSVLVGPDGKPPAVVVDIRTGGPIGDLK